MSAKANWKIALIDDEVDVLQISKLVLSNLRFDDRGVEILTATSESEGIKLFENNDDIAVAYVDVVMETKHAGLDLVKHIRERLKNSTTRIILRTGNPGSAPQKEVVKFFEIDDYKEKTELTADRLETSVITSLRAYRNIQSRVSIEEGLERVIKCHGNFYTHLGISDFASKALSQIFYVLDINENQHGLFLSEKSDLLFPLAEYQNGLTENLEGKLYALPTIVESDLNGIIGDGVIHQSSTGIAFSLKPNQEERFFFWVKSGKILDENQKRLANIFLSRLSVSLTNALLQKEIIDAQSEILGRLCGAVESRSKETGSHIFRIAFYCRKLARLLKMSDEDVELITLASPMHDIGKIAIPDHILSKPTSLDEEEWKVIKTHPEVGYKLLSKAKFRIMESAAIISLTHHEKWDGSGYPRGIAGDEIPIFGRIVAVADVFDALLSKRSYKDAWSLDRVKDELIKLQGTHLDSDLVSLVLDNLEEFHNIYLENMD